MNEDTLISVHCYAGDADLVRRALPIHMAHGRPVVVMSPVDSSVTVYGIGVSCVSSGKRAYIGADSWTRQHEHMKLLLSYPAEYFLLNDADSFCVSAKIPDGYYARAEGAIWAGIIEESRPHRSPYPKLALHPPYFLSRDSMHRMLVASARVSIPQETPYIDHAMLAWACEAGLSLHAHAELQHDSPVTFSSDTPPEVRCWQELDHRIRHTGMVMMHPIKTQEQLQLCVGARKFYERNGG